MVVAAQSKRLKFRLSAGCWLVTKFQLLFWKGLENHIEGVVQNVDYVVSARGTECRCAVIR